MCDVIRRVSGHGNSVVNVEARRVVGIGPEPDVAETSSERRCERAVVSGGAARVPVMKTAQMG